MRRGLVVILTLLFWPFTAWSATRLGLHVTQEELDAWRTRAVSGPYRVVGDVSANSPGDWAHIVANKETFRANTTINYWAGSTAWTVGQCVTQSTMNSAGFPGNNNRSWGDHLRDAAFFAMVLPGDPTAADAATKARQALLNQASQALTPKTYWPDKTTFCEHTVIGDGNPRFDMATWIKKLLFAYDYLKIYGNMTSADRAALDAWFLGAGEYWRSFFFGPSPTFGGHYSTSTSGFSNAEADFDTTVRVGGLYDGIIGYGCPMGGAIQYLYDGGPRVSEGGTEMHNNRAMVQMTLMANVGVMLNNAELIRHAKMYVMGMLTYNTWPDGTLAEMKRVYDYPLNDEDHGWVYSAYMLGSIAEIADVLARAGDMELYTYQTSSGICHVDGTNAGGPKTLVGAVTHLAQYVDHTVARYQPGAAHDLTHQIDAVTRLLDNCGRVTDTGAEPLVNHYAQSDYLKNIYMRTPAGGPDPPPAYPVNSGCGSGSYNWGGAWGSFSGVLFMFGQTEHLDIYAQGSPPPTCTVSAPTTFPRYSTMADPLTTVAGTASAGVTSVTWECLTCSTTTGTATGDETWSIASLAGWDVGDNLVTVTAHDAEAQTGTCSLTVQYQTAPALTTELIAHWPLDTLADGSTPDATGGGHTGQLTGGVNSVAGQVGNAALFDGSTGLITVSGTLGNPSAVTLSLWVKLTSVPTSTEYELLNLGNRVGMRVSPAQQLRGFHYVSGSYNGRNAPGLSDTNWHHVAYTVAAGVQWWYVDGVPVLYSTDAGGIDWTGAGSTTLLGRHPDGSNWLAGTLDEVRVYSRALTGVDIAALASPSTPPTCTVTTPADDPYETDTTPLATFAGTATDDVDVDHVTWTNSLGGGGTATGGESWSVSNIPLFPGGSGGMGSNVLTATAHDGDGQTGTCSVTVEYTPPPPPPSDVMGIYTGFTGAGVLRRR
jgi:hypothetical protein